FNMPFILELKGAVTHQKLESSFRMLIQRHTVLKTNYHEIDGEFFQVCDERKTFILGYQDISDQDSEKRSQVLLDIIEREASMAFDLENDLMLRAHLVKLDVDRFKLFITFHHIAADAWSLRIALQE